MRRIDSPVADEQPKSWEWMIMHINPGNLQKSGAIIHSMQEGIANIKKISPTSAKIIECTLPYVVQETTELNTKIASIIPELDAQTVTQRVFAMAPKDHPFHNQNPHQVEEMVEGFISSTRASQRYYPPSVCATISPPHLPSTLKFISVLGGSSC